MSGVQVLILIVGAVLFTVSFFIPEQNTNTKEIHEKEEKAVKEVLDRELSKIQSRVDSAVEDSLEYAKDNADRAMDRITNEKMTAINEYSATVMEEIHKNHEEAVFLYDMLNHKHDQVKGTLANLNQTVRSVKHHVENLQSAAEQKITEEEKPAEKKAKEVSGDRKTKRETVAAAVKAETEKTEKPAEKKKTAAVKKTPAEKNVKVVIGAADDELNSNTEILNLHRAGKSNMEIARELGLGIGEVKLVIDLFEGGM